MKPFGLLFLSILFACGDGDKDNSAPLVSFTTDSDQTFDEGTAITFEATVSDIEDASDALSLDWIIDGTTLSTTGADASGVASFTTADLTFGSYTLVLTATDTEGLSTSQNIDFVINGLPSTPSIQLTPNPAFTDSTLEVLIEEASVDPEGEDVSYTYTWSVDDVVQEDYTTASVPASATRQGETWTVEVLPSDGISLGISSSLSTVIENTVPTLSDLTITPNDTVYNDDSLLCSVIVTDADEVLNPSFKWQLNGLEVGDTDTLSLADVAATPNDQVTCLASVTDSQDASAEIQTTLVLANRIPTISSLSITPNTDVTTDSSLVCSAQTDDLDGDTLSLSYTWTLDGGMTYTGDSLQLDPTMVSPNSVVLCSLTVDDNHSGLVTESVEVTLINQPPQLSSVELQYVDILHSTSLLTCAYSGSDADLQTITPTFLWTNSTTGVTLPSNSDTLQLDPTMVSPNDTVSCAVTLHDGIEDSAPMTATDTINNTTPVVFTEASISTTGSMIGSTWTCSASFEDQDDGTLTPTYSWQDSSGSTVDTGASIVIDSINSSPEEALTCVATATDNQGLSITSSVSEVVSNTPPLISSVNIDQTSIYTSDIISVTVVYSDADDNNDTTLSLDWYVTDDTTGQEQLVQSGNLDTLDGTTAFDKNDLIRVEATVTDAFTSTSLASSLVTVLNTPPSATSLSIGPDPAYADLDALDCTVVVSDEDGDTLQQTFTWTDTQGTSFTSGITTALTDTLDMEYVTDGDWTCTVSIDDGTEVTTDSTTLTVEPSACDGISCGPDGSCTNLGATYSCTCRPGFEGNNCELDIDECAVNNGGCTGSRSDCINTMGGHYCVDSSAVLAFPETNNVAAETYYNIAVIPVNGRDAFPADPNDYVTSIYQPYRQDWYDTDQLGDLIFDHPDGMHAFFKDISYDKANFQGVVVDWYDDYATEKTDDDLFYDRDFYFSEAYDKIDPTQFDIFMLVGLVDTGYTQKGWGMGNSVPDENGGRLQGKGITYLINSNFFNEVGQTRFGGWVLPSVPWVHELFHTIGIFGHSNTLWCYPTLTDYQNSITNDDFYYNASETLSSICEINGYGDPFSLMGERLWATHPSVASKIEMDWIAEEQKTEIDATGIFFEEVVPLYPHNLESISDNVAIQIMVPPFDITTPAGNTISFDRLTIETRVEDGFDTYLSALGTGVRNYNNVAFRYLETTYSWNSQYSMGVYDLVHPIDLQGALMYLDSTTDNNEAVYLLDGNPAIQGVLTDEYSPKGHLGNAGKFASAMLNVGDTFSSDLIPFTVSVETGPDGGINGDITVRVTPVQ